MQQFWFYSTNPALHAPLGCNASIQQTTLTNKFLSSLQIERWWRELHERLEKSYKKHLLQLKDDLFYDPHDQTDRLVVVQMLLL